MSEIKIEKGIAIPPCTRTGIYPWRKMKIGDSFFIKESEIKNISSAAQTFSSRQSPKWKFVCRSVDGGVRVWRIE